MACYHTCTVEDKIYKYKQGKTEYLISFSLYTLENHSTRTAQSSCGGCSGRVHKIVYLAVKKGNILVNILLLKIFIAAGFISDNNSQ